MCSKDPRDFRLPPAPLEGEDENNFIAEHVPRPERIFKTAGRITLELEILRCWGDFVWFVMISGHGEGFLLVDDLLWKPVPGSEIVFFQGFVVGRFHGKPLLSCPPKNSPGALIRRPQPHDQTRILDLCAGIGGWDFGLDLVQSAVGYPGRSRDVVSVEIDPVPARCLTFFTCRFESSPGVFGLKNLLTPCDVNLTKQKVNFVRHCGRRVSMGNKKSLQTVDNRRKCHRSSRQRINLCS